MRLSFLGEWRAGRKLLGLLALALLLSACGSPGPVGSPVTLRLPNVPAEVQAVTFTVNGTESPTTLSGNPRAATLERVLPAGEHTVVAKGLDQPNGVVLYKSTATVMVAAGTTVLELTPMQRVTSSVRVTATDLAGVTRVEASVGGVSADLTVSGNTATGTLENVPTGRDLVVSVMGYEGDTLRRVGEGRVTLSEAPQQLSVALQSLDQAPPSVPEITAPASVTQNAEFTLGVAASDPKGTLQRVVVAWGDGQEVTQNASGGSASLTFTHSYATTGSKTVTVTVFDTQGRSNSATRTVQVTAPGGPQTVDVTLAVTNLPSGTTGVQAVITPTSGVGAEQEITLQASGNRWQGTATLQDGDAYTVLFKAATPAREVVSETRDFTPQAPANIAFEWPFVPSNTPPFVAQADTANVLAGQSVLIDVLANDSGDGLTLLSVTQPSLGSAAVSGAQVRYTAPNSVGETTFQYTVRDAYGAQKSATVSVFIGPIPVLGFGAARTAHYAVTGASHDRSVTLKNDGQADLNITGFNITGTAGGDFSLLNPPGLPTTLEPGQALPLTVRYTAASAGVKRATLEVASNDPQQPVRTLPLRGLTPASSEPSLQWVLDTFDTGINVGDPNPSVRTMPATFPLGDEVNAQRFVKAGPGPVTIEPLGVFAAASSPTLAFGYYTGINTTTELFTVPSDTRMLLPTTSGSLSFEPVAPEFGFYSRWPSLSNRLVYTEDALNTFSGAIPHHVRVYPLRDGRGSDVPGAYVLATEETTSGYDFNDIVVIVRNVRPTTAGTGAAQIKLENPTGRAGGALQPGFYDDWLVFNRIAGGFDAPERTWENLQTRDVMPIRIRNTGGETLTVSGLTFGGSTATQYAVRPEDNNGLVTPFTISAGSFRDVNIRFVGTSTGRGVRRANLTVVSNAANQAPRIELAGLHMTRPEGNNEVTLTNIVTAFGWTMTMGEPLSHERSSAPAGDEVVSRRWVRADSTKPIYVRQIAAFHSCCTSADWFQLGTTMTGNPHRFTHDALYGQSIFPPLRGSTLPAERFYTDALFDSSFPIVIMGYTTDTNGNLGVRTWPIKDRAGIVLPDTYLVVQDFVAAGCGPGTPANCDYNDNMYVITNVKPAP